nr:MAG: capsid protein [Cressdnaviricota sp.]
MVYAPRRSGFRGRRGKLRSRPTAWRGRKVGKKSSWWRRKRARYSAKIGFLPRKPYVLATCHYSTALTISNGAAAFNFTQYRLNGPQDPTVSGGTPLATGFPELSSLYQKYRVFAAKVQVQVWNTSNIPTRMGLFCGESTCAPVNPGSANAMLQNITELGYPSKVMLSQAVMSSPIYLRQFVKFKRVLGRQALYDDTTAADITAVPSKQVWCTLGNVAADGSAVGGSCAYNIKIKYYCKFFEPRQIFDN